ncbi:hypothetical protein G6O69_02195 [Pseudenhygromyxa sp. WMMC2535]|uniref:hypothetical protein n=1 Tax=Pseudenhygromyxa sp. WMMC2535 TaxID=2712867 RepID=UPI00155501DD|nr:hypothetical protein [Pseudenhygromyxa sp. WMMC2535]NVB36626.1 hypothetical protein [Pseudenhygromyxa sp. WMMC2535]
MTESHRRWLLGIVALVVGLVLAPSSAHARKGEWKLSVTLGAESEAAPGSTTAQATHVCVITRGAGPHSVRLDDLWMLKSETAKLREYDGKIDKALAEKIEDGKLELLDEIQLGLRELAEFNRPCGGVDLGDDDEVRKYSGQYPSCQPRLDPVFGTDDEDYLTCAKNNATTGVSMRSLEAFEGTKGRDWDVEIPAWRVLLLDLRSSMSEGINHFPIQEMRVIGDELELSLGVDYEKTPLTLTVVGGHYLSGAQTKLEDGEHIDIEPRCQWADFELPPQLELESLDDLAYLEGRSSKEPYFAKLFRGKESFELDWDSCIRGVPGERSLSVLTPVIASSQDKRLRVEIRNGTLPSESALEPEDASTSRAKKKRVQRGEVVLEARWNTPFPQPGAALQATQLTFSWEVDSCFYMPSRDCPEAEIQEFGLSCERLNGGEIIQSTKEGQSGVCYYSCPRQTEEEEGEDRKDRKDERDRREDWQGGVVLPFVNGQPLHIRFWNADDRRGWTEELRMINQRLQGHVEPGQRQLEIELDPKTVLQLPGGKFDEPTGKERRDARRDLPWRERFIKPESIRGIEFSYANELGEHVTRRMSFSEETKGKAKGSEGESCTCAVDCDCTKKKGGGESLRAHFPLLSCTETVQYRYLGDRHYRPMNASVNAGKLKLAGHGAAGIGRRVYIFVAGGYMPSLALSERTESTPVFNFAGGEFQVGLAQWPLSNREGNLSPAQGWRFEYTVEFSFSRVFAYPISGDGSTAERPVSIPYTRMGGGFAFLRRVGHDDFVALGAGLSLMWGHAMWQTQRSAFDPRYAGFDFSMRPRFEIRLRPFYAGKNLMVRRLEVMLRPGLILLEDVPRHSTDMHGAPQLDLRENRAVWATMTGGLAMSF